MKGSVRYPDKNLTQLIEIHNSQNDPITNKENIDCIERMVIIRDIKTFGIVDYRNVCEIVDKSGTDKTENLLLKLYHDACMIAAVECGLSRKYSFSNIISKFSLENKRRELMFIFINFYPCSVTGKISCEDRKKIKDCLENLFKNEPN